MASTGWERFGQALGGGGIARENAFQTGALRGAQMESALAEARLRRSQEIGRQNAAARAYESGNRDLGDALLRGETYEATTKAGNELQHGSMQKELWDNAHNPALDQNRQNALLAAFQGKPQDLTKVEGNVILNPTITPDSQTIRPTDIGTAMIGADNALVPERAASAAAHYAAAHNSEASALEHGAQTDKIRGMPLGPLTPDVATQINQQATSMLNDQKLPQAQVDAWIQEQYALHGAGMHPGNPEANKPTALTGEQIKGSFGTATPGVINQKELSRFYEFQRSRNIPNATVALQQFRTDMSNTNAGADSTAAPRPLAPAPEPSTLDNIGSSIKSGAASLGDMLTGGSAPAGPVNPASQRSAADAVQPKSKDEYDALPVGTLYVNPSDGSLRRKGGAPAVVAPAAPAALQANAQGYNVTDIASALQGQ